MQQSGYTAGSTTTTGDRMRAAMLARPSYAGLPSAEKPAFEFITADGQYFAIFATGEVKGLEGGGMIINRIPRLVAAAVRSAQSDGR